MDSDEMKEQEDNIDEELEDDSSEPESEEFFEKCLDAQAIAPVFEENAEAQSTSIDSAAAELSAAPFSEETEGACKIPDTGPYMSLIKRRRENNIREDDKDKHFCIAECNQRVREHDLINKNKNQPLEDRPGGSSSTESSRSNSKASSMIETYSEEKGACGISEPSSSTQQEFLVHRYQELSLMENTQHERVTDRVIERSPRSDAASSTFESSLRASEGAIGLPGPMASFIQRIRDIDLMDDNSDDEQPLDRPVWPLERRQRETSASYQGSRSGSFGECSEESISRSTSEASHSSGLQENKEASASDSIPFQREQQHNREFIPPEDEAEGEATDEDEADIETEEHYPDSDSERKGYSL